MDLNIDNYELKDLLNVFKLKINFNENDLKKAKEMVHAVHPDKSGLDCKYFIFYKKAYDLLLHIHKINHKTKNAVVDNVNYDAISSEYYREDRNIAVNKLKDSKQFNEKFNKLFDEYYIKKEDGYGDWLKQNTESMSYTELKKQSRDLALHNNIKSNYKYGNYSELDDNSSYTNDNYMDIKEAYTTGSVIGVDEHLDFDKVKKYKSVEELKQDRSLNIRPLSVKESEQLLYKQHEEENAQSIQMIYDLNVEYEKNVNNQNNFWSKFLSLKL